MCRVFLDLLFTEWGPDKIYSSANDKTVSGVRGLFERLWVTEKILTETIL